MARTIQAQLDKAKRQIQDMEVREALTRDLIRRSSYAWSDDFVTHDKVASIINADHNKGKALEVANATIETLKHVIASLTGNPCGPEPKAD